MYQNEEMIPIVVVLLHLHKILKLYKKSWVCIEYVYNFKYFHDKTIYFFFIRGIFFPGNDQFFWSVLNN